MLLSSLKGLAFTRGLSAYNTKHPKYENIREKYENGDECATLKINQIGSPKLGVLACNYCGGITAR